MTDEFCAHFLPDGRVLFGHEDELSELGLSLDEHRKLPDAIVSLAERNWLPLLQDASRRGPIDEERRDELRLLFGGTRADLVYVSCFAQRAELRKCETDFAWGSSAWCADEPEHLIHFNGDQLLGPYEPAPTTA